MPLVSDSLLVIGLVILFLVSIWIVPEIIFRIAIALKFADTTRKPDFFSLPSHYPITTVVTLVTAVALALYLIAR